MWRTLFSAIETSGGSFELPNGCLACVENCNRRLCEASACVAKERDDGVSVGCGCGEPNVRKGVFEVLYLRWRPGTHPYVMMRGVRDSGGVGEVSYGVETFVCAGEGIKFCHQG